MPSFINFLALLSPLHLAWFARARHWLLLLWSADCVVAVTAILTIFDCGQPVTLLGYTLYFALQLLLACLGVSYCGRDRQTDALAI